MIYISKFVLILVVLNSLLSSVANAKDFKLICYQEQMMQDKTNNYTRMPGFGMPADGTGSMSVLISGNMGIMETITKNQSWKLKFEATKNYPPNLIHAYFVLPGDDFFKFIYIFENGSDISWIQQISNARIFGKCKKTL